MSKANKSTEWPPVHIVTHRSGKHSYQVDLGLVEGKRKRVPFPTQAEAETYRIQCRIAKKNEGISAFALPTDVRLDAAKANKILGPHSITLLEAAKFYQKHVLAYKTAPAVREIVDAYLNDCLNRNLRPRTLDDLRYRLNSFAADFGDSRLSDLTLEEVQEWVEDEEWGMRTRINFLTKISQLYRFALSRKWVDSNITEAITRPTVDETKPEIFSIPQAEQLLSHADEFGLLPYIALGLFAGLRSAEMVRLDSNSIKFDAKLIRIGADVAKKRSQRVVEMQDALLAWLEPAKAKLSLGGKIVEESGFRKSKALLMEAAGIEIWPSNGLRHSFASYHLEKFSSSDQTALQMGHRSTAILHSHYKALVSKAEAKDFWNLRPKAQTTPEKSQPPHLTELEGRTEGVGVAL
jgi:integrase